MAIPATNHQTIVGELGDELVLYTLLRAKLDNIAAYCRGLAADVDLTSREVEAADLLITDLDAELRKRGFGSVRRVLGYLDGD